MSSPVIALLAVIWTAVAVDRSDDVVARVGGFALTVGEFHAFIGREYASDERAERVLKHLLEQQVIRVEATRAGVEIAPSELERRYARLDEENAERSRQAGGREKSLGEMLAEQGVTKEEFLSQLEVSLLAERMAGLEFGIAIGEDVPYAKTNLWIRDRMAKATVRRSGLAPDEVARVNGRPITAGALGRLYAEDLSAKARHDMMTEFIDTHVIRTAAKSAGIELDPADLDAAVEARRARVKEDPKYVGASLDQLLEKTGRSVEWLKGSARFVNQVLMERLIEDRWPGDALRAFYRRNLEDIDRLHGPSVRVRGVFLKAGHRGAASTGFAPRLYEEAERELMAVLDRVANGQTSIEVVAKSRSEHEASKARDGDLGFIRPSTPRLEEVATEALATTRDQWPIGPIRTVDGVWLVEVVERKDRPEFEEIERQVRNYAAGTLFRDLRSAADIERRE